MDFCVDIVIMVIFQKTMINMCPSLCTLCAYDYYFLQKQIKLSHSAWPEYDQFKADQV